MQQFPKMNYRIALMLSISAFLIRDGKAKLTVVPKNKAVVEGDVVIMNCTTDTDDKLLWRIANETHVRSLYTGNKFTNNYPDCCEINNSTKEEFTLKVRTRKDIPLHYVCEEPVVEIFGADLVVLDKQATDLATQPDETLNAEYEELDLAPKRSAEDNIHVLSVYEQIIDINKGAYSTIPCHNETSYFPQEGDYASPAECHSPPKSVYASLFTTPEQV